MKVPFEGRDYEFPDDATEAEIMEALGQQPRQATPKEADAPRRPFVYSQESNIDRAKAAIGGRLTDFQQGMAEPLIGGVQLYEHAAGQNTDVIDRAAREAAADAGPGFDPTRVAGNALMLAPTAFVGGGPVVGGAIAGGLGGLTAPVTSDIYAGAKTAQTATGGVFGGILGKVAPALVTKAADAVIKTVNFVRQRFPGQMPNVEVIINQTLQRAGIDHAHVGQEVIDGIKAEVSRAMAAGGAQNPEAVANRAAANVVGTRLTQGQEARNPLQWSDERSIAQASGGQELADQYQNALRTSGGRLQGMQPVPPMNTPAAGRRVMEPLADANQRGSQMVRALYTQAENAPGNPQFVGSRGFVDDVTEAFRRQRLLRNIPPQVQSVLDDAASGRYSVRTASQDLQVLNGLIRQLGDTPEGVAARIARDRLDNSLGASLTEADTFYRTARQAAAQRAGIEEAIPALRAVRDGSATPDDFMRKFVYGATQEEARSLRDFLNRADPQAWQQVKSQVVEDFRQAAGATDLGDTSRFSQAGFNKMLNSMRQDGTLDVYFAPQEVTLLNSIGRVTKAVQEPPAGVNMTGFAGAAKLRSLFGSLMERIGSPVAKAVVAPASNALSARAALRQAPVASIPRYQLPEQGRNALARLSGLSVGVSE